MSIVAWLFQREWEGTIQKREERPAIVPHHTMDARGYTEMAAR